LRWLGRRPLDARLHEDEPPYVPLLLELPQHHFLAPLLQLFGSGAEVAEKTRAEDQQEDDGGVKDAGEQDPRAAGNGAPDDGFVLVAILEVEMYQQRRRSEL